MKALLHTAKTLLSHALLKKKTMLGTATRKIEIKREIKQQ
jgi:hypothetical protein